MSDALSATGVALRPDELIALRQVAMTAEADPVLAALPGGFSTRRKGHGLEVADMREYVDGDDLRHLDRGTTARTGRLHVRQFQEERDRITLFVADFRQAMFWGLRRVFRSVAAAEILALIGWTVVEQGGRVSLLAITPQRPVVVAPRGRARGMRDVIGGLVEAHAEGLSAVRSGQEDDLPLDIALSRVDRLVPSGAEIVIASGFDNGGTGLVDRLDALARRRKPQLVLVTDAEASRMPAGRYPLRLSDGRLVTVNLGRAEAGAATTVREIAGRRALVVNASDPVQDTARRIAAAFPLDRAA